MEYIIVMMGQHDCVDIVYPLLYINFVHGMLYI